MIGTGGAATNLKHQSGTAGTTAAAHPHQRVRIVGNREHGIRPQPLRQPNRHLHAARGRPGAVRGLHPLRRLPAKHEVGWAAREGRIPLGYFEDPDATRKTFPVVDGKRVVISGDRAALEADGTLRLYGRDSLVVNTGGEKVFVEEVEEVLRAHPDIADALVVGRPSERWGDELVALVQPRDGGVPESLSGLLRLPFGQVQGAQGVHRRRSGSSPG